MLKLLQIGFTASAHAMSRRIWLHVFWILFFQFLKPAVESVIFSVGNRRIILIVILVRISVEKSNQLLHLFKIFCTCRHAGYAPY